MQPVDWYISFLILIVQIFLKYCQNMVQIWLKTSPVEVKSAGSSWYKKAGIAAKLLSAVVHCGLVWFGMVVCGTLWFGVV